MKRQRVLTRREIVVNDVRPTKPTLTEFLLARTAETQIRVYDGVNRRVGGAEWRDIEILNLCHASRMIVAQSQSDYLHEPVDSLEIRHLAAMYADHPDYDEAWRP